MEILSQYLLLILLCTLLNIIFIKKEFFIKFYPSYNPVQKIHEKYVPPLGGVVIFVSVYLFSYFFNKESILLSNYIIIPSILIIFIAFIEDVTGRVTAKLRLLTIFISSYFFCYNTSLPSLEIWFIGEYINQHEIIQILFFSICLTGLSNGVNMIDGMNGLAGFTTLSMLLSLFSVITLTGIYSEDINLIIILSLSLLVFLGFNFPFGKIFLGDSGSYWLGWILGVLVIKTYANNELNTWGAAIILFYPSMEVVFSTIRKLIQRKSPLDSDIYHLHLKLYFIIKGPVKRSKVFNSFTTVCLMPLWITPPLAIMWTQYNADFNKYFLIFLTAIYLFYYKIIPDRRLEDL